MTKCGATDGPHDFCYYNPDNKVAELNTTIREMRSEMHEYRDISDRRDDELFSHMLSMECKQAESDKQYGILVKTNTDAINHLEKAVNHMSEVNEKMNQTLIDVDKKVMESSHRVELTDRRVDEVEDDLKGLKGSVNDVRKELRSVDDKSKIDVVQLGTDQAKKNLLSMLGGAGLFGVIIALIEYFMSMN